MTNFKVPNMNPSTYLKLHIQYLRLCDKTGSENPTKSDACINRSVKAAFLREYPHLAAYADAFSGWERANMEVAQ